MTRKEFIIFLVENNIPFKEVEEYDTVYVYSKKEYDEKADFISYLRVSHFGNDLLYTRDCGIVDNMTVEEVLERSKELGLT